MSLLDLAEAELYRVAVIIEPIGGYSGDVWNIGEWAAVVIRIINSSDSVLSDFVLSLDISGPATLIFFGPPTHLEWYWSELEPGEQTIGWFILEANDAGLVEVRANISAEVIPYPNLLKGYRSENVHPR